MPLCTRRAIKPDTSAGGLGLWPWSSAPVSISCSVVIKPPLFFLPRSFPPLLTKSFPKTPNIFLSLQLHFSFPPLTKYLPIPNIFLLFLLRSSFPPPIRDINYHQERFDDNHYNGLVWIWRHLLSLKPHIFLQQIIWIYGSKSRINWRTFQGHLVLFVLYTCGGKGFGLMQRKLSV